VLASTAALLVFASHAHAAEQGLALSGQWLRVVIPSRPAAGYFRLSNNSDKAHELVGASSDACGTLTLHESINRGGVDRMVDVKSVPIPPHGSIVFAPGGYHLMCLSPSPSVKRGSSVAITLYFVDGGTVVSNFPVRSAIGK
jgi:copper(I)-binding protein